MRVCSLSYERLLILFTLLQVMFWFGLKIPDGSPEAEEAGGFNVIWEGTSNIYPNLGIVPDVPTIEGVKAMSLGDEQFYFRVLAFNIQNAGDTFGRSTPLHHYDYEKLYNWWTLLDELDSQSNYMPLLVSFYYSLSQKPKRDVPHVVRYLEEHADKDPEKKWWWYVQAAYAAKYKLEDQRWALRIANKVHSLPESADIPIWARQLKVFMHEGLGEYKEAYETILEILKNYDDLAPEERNFIDYFIKDRIEYFENAHGEAEYRAAIPEVPSVEDMMPSTNTVEPDKEPQGQE